MSSQENVAACYKQILNILNEPVLFVDTKESIVFGNQASHMLLQTDDVSGQSIHTFLDFEPIKQDPYTPKVLGLHTVPGKLLTVKSLKVSEHLYCLAFTQLSLQERNAEASAYVKTQEGGMAVHTDTQILDADDTFMQLFGYTLQELKTMTLSHLLSNWYLKSEQDHVLDGYYGTNHLIGYSRNGSTFYASLHTETYISHENGSQTQISLVKDISEQVQNEQQINYMAYHDRLTGLPNRALFIQTLNKSIKTVKRNNQQLAVYCIDLDYFKEINDIMGYAFGDSVLMACSDRLKDSLGDTHFLSRMGDDDFLIMHRDCQSEQEAEQFAETLIKAFETPIVIRDYELSVSLSIGISMYPKDGQTANKLIKHADSAMYVIKADYRNHYQLFDASISENFKTMLTMENELRKALKQDQLKLYYQPQKCLDTGDIVGMEALIRWEHPVRGLVSPGEFIPLAEKTDLIQDIGDWVIKEACRQNKAWQKQGYDPIIVSVNLSAKQFQQNHFVHKIEQVLDQTGLDAEYLELEITESMAMSSGGNMLDTMAQLRQLGVHVSIDDFGTGYSSLKYLTIFPVTKLKIDKSFISEVQSQNEAIVKSIINMSHALEMKVIAEGVETNEQLAFLKKEACDEMQGFYLSKPLPPDKLTGLLKGS